MSQFDTPQQATTSWPFKIVLKENDNEEVYVHPRPELTRFIQLVANLNGKVEVALHTMHSAEFLAEVLKWIDGMGHCKYLFHGKK